MPVEKRQEIVDAEALVNFSIVIRKCIQTKKEIPNKQPPVF
jgi:hypothetical protein